MTQREVLIGLAIGGEIRDIPHDQRIDGQRGERPVTGADPHEPELAQRSIAVELARDRRCVGDAEDLAEQEFVDERPSRIVGEDPVEPRELAAQPRRRDREQDRDRDLRELEVAREHVERRQPPTAAAFGGDHHLLGRTLATDRGRELVRRAPGDESQQAADLVGERRLRGIRLADPAAVPRLGDRDVGARADELEPQIDRLADLARGGVRRDRDRIEADERRIGERRSAGSGSTTT